MRRLILVMVTVLWPLGAAAQNAVVQDIVAAHILPRFEVLAMRAADLSQAAQDTCAPDAAPLRAAYGAAFDAWVSASHLRFGPTEVADRGFALAFWPDARGATPRALNALLTAQDPVAASAEDYAQVSIAARGFYALEYLLYDAALKTAGEAAYHCTLIRTITADIDNTAAAILSDWQDSYAERLTGPEAGGTYRSDAEAVQELFKVLTTGLQFTSEARLGRPLGTFDRPRPKRAEAWRSARSARHVALSLEATRDLAARLATRDAALAETMDGAFARALTQLAALNDPAFAGVAQPQTRIKVEALQATVQRIRALVSSQLGPTLGVAAGFNALDGD